jgi:hypothetical protein
MKLLKEYESVTQEVLYCPYNQYCRMLNDFNVRKFYFVVCGLKTIGHGNPDNNLESLCSDDYILKV